MRDASLSIKLYRWLLKLYPASFREEYAGLMELEFRDELTEANGAWALAALWFRLLTDLARSIPLQLSREVLQDAMHTFRLWANRPWYTAAALLALAIGIGANTGVFSVINGLLLRSLPFREPDHLVSMEAYLIPHDTAKQFHDWRQQVTYLQDAAFVEQSETNLGGEGETRRAYVAQVSSNFFSLLGAQPALGRGFAAGEDATGRDQIAVISYGLWQQLFAGSDRALGSTIRVSGMPLTIVGVAPRGFDYPADTILWKVGGFSRGDNRWQGIGRLKPGVTLLQARQAFAAEMDKVLLELNSHGRNMKHHPVMNSLQDKLAGPVKDASLLLMAGVALILFIACANVANLLMARTADRAVELSIRSALGASRVRLTQQLLTESLLLSLVAALAGLLVAFATASVAAKAAPPPIAALSYSVLDLRVLAFTVAAAIITSLFFGILPALFGGRLRIFGSRGSSTVHHSRMVREFLVAAQVMLTIILLASSVSVGRAFVHLLQMDRGFDRNQLVTASVSIDGTTHQVDGRQLPYFEEALARIRKLPGVLSASSTEFLPLYTTMFMGGPFGVDGIAAKQNSMQVPVSPDYFKTMGGSILYGREFNDAEVRADSKVVLVNEMFARDFGAPIDALGHQVTLGNTPSRKIIGIVRGMDYMAPGEAANTRQLFIPDHSPGAFAVTFVVRVVGRAEDRLAMVRDAIRSVDPHVPVFGVKTMGQRMADALARPRFYMIAFSFFAGFALLLTLLGTYGAISYAAMQRTHEMGVRLALGTTPGALRRVLLGQGLLTVSCGAILGIAGAIASGWFLESLIDGAKSLDPAAGGGTVLLIGLAASASIWVATRRIAGLDVMEVLRSE